MNKFKSWQAMQPLPEASIPLTASNRLSLDRELR
jgi:hypothetical protein